MAFSFYKEESGKWFVDLPQWNGDKSDLEMVLGADILLNIISNNESRVKLFCDINYFDNAEIIELVSLGKDEGGGYYFIKKYESKTLNLDLWICDVIKFVFGTIPNRIYFKKLECC